ncbi:riboflavin synthase [Paucilactobacillus suebicus]|uniref:Riboflavin synthase n=1 Tax=Paucilactobacillus suebicus DSM 5007 = KCTC 3549 TaxID=1423807 RepID=A0A0R1WB92_9LACO|nr:riboflavin synthase [Paucilactobacillus suebicus]KRM12294.1 riboflavin synthase subunit alpha [Paucilactobacillus suebicus DSM 5007 = KCTC 3549]
MFTGIIKGIGTVTEIKRISDTAKLQISTDLTGQINSQIGDSISVDGVCLTITKLDNQGFTVDVMPETVHRTNISKYVVNRKVDLEPALLASDRLDGHFVLGHVDCTSTVISRHQDENALVISFSLPEKYKDYVVEKGSVSVDGVSLTVVDAINNTFSVSLIPHTMDQTVLGDLMVNDVVNIETDVLGKYIVNKAKEKLK